MTIKYSKEELLKLIELYYKQYLQNPNAIISVNFVKAVSKNGHNRYIPAIEVKENIQIKDITKEATEILTREQVIEILNVIHKEYGYEVQDVALIGNNYKLTGNDLKEAVIEVTRQKKESLSK